MGDTTTTTFLITTTTIPYGTQPTLPMQPTLPTVTTKTLTIPFGTQPIQQTLLGPTKQTILDLMTAGLRLTPSMRRSGTTTVSKLKNGGQPKSVVYAPQKMLNGAWKKLMRQEGTKNSSKCALRLSTS